jgi:hypothetical protein
MGRGAVGALRLAAALGVAAMLVPREARAAGGAYQVDTAEVSEVGSCKVEAWVSSAKTHDFIASVAPACVVDLYRPVELSAQLSRVRADEEWLSFAVPKVKTNIIPTALGSWGVAVTGQVAFDLLTREAVGFFATVPATLRLSNVVRINANIGWAYDRPLDRNYLTYGLGFDWRTPDNVWTLTGEMFGLVGKADEDARGTIQPRFQLGLRFRPVDRFNVDVIYGRNLTGENSHWITFATIMRFKPAENGEGPRASADAAVRRARETWR